MSKKMNRENTLAVMIDMQERLLAAMPDKEQLVRDTAVLLEGLRTLEIPVLVTQQYTKGLGNTDVRLLEAGGLDCNDYFEKITYSCLEDDGFSKGLTEYPERKTVLLFGIESHICVWQTAQDLLEKGYQVQVVCESTMSRKESDRSVAFRRMEQAGVVLTTIEACLFELLERAGTPEFKTISRLIK